MRAVKSSPGPIGAASLKDVFSPGLELNGFFVSLTLTVPHTIASTYMGGVGGNIGQRYTPLITLADCMRGTAQDGGTW